MKKLLLVLSLMLSIAIFAQKEFVRNYTNYSVKKSTEKDFKIAKYNSMVIYNERNTADVTIYFGGKTYQFRSFGSPEAGGSGEMSYQSIDITDGTEDGVIILYDNEKYGVLFIFKSYALGLF